MRFVAYIRKNERALVRQLLGGVNYLYLLFTLA